MSLEEKAADCGYVMIDSIDGLYDLADMSGSIVMLSVERGSINKFIASKAKNIPALRAKALASTLPLPEIDVDPDPFGDD